MANVALRGHEALRALALTAAMGQCLWSTTGARENRESPAILVGVKGHR